VVITVATLIGHLIPLLPFVWLSRTPALKMVAIGLGAAAIGFLIGRLFHTAGA
jgi:VIT1/CCC1 family predicted Fe2+/Mn2+ transporter